MNKSKLQNGITLVALIVTIIVLLILAVVAINSVNKTGIIDYAHNAVEAYEEGEAEEEELIQGYMQYLEDNYPGNGNTDTGSGDTLVAMYKAGTLKVGDYVNYTPKGVTSYSSDGNTAGSLTGYTKNLQTVNREDLGWRVLGYDETNNQILLISAEPTTEGAVYFFGETGYNNYETVLNNTCNALYGNSDIGAKARSVSIADFERLLNLDIDFWEGQNHEFLEMNLTDIQWEIILGPLKESEWDYDDAYKLPFLYLFSDKVRITDGDEDTIGYVPATCEGYVKETGITFFYGDESEMDRVYDYASGYVRVFRPVVALDSNTTITDVSICENQNYEFDWYDYYGKQLGS